MGDTKPVVAAEGDKTTAESPAAAVIKAEQPQQQQVDENKATAVEMPKTPAPAAPAPAINGHKPEAKGTEEGEAQELAPAFDPPTASTRKRKAEQDTPPAGASAAAESKASNAKPTQVLVGLAGGVKREDLAAAVRSRMDEVLKEGEDDEMRQDARLINFLGEVEEAQVCRGSPLTNETQYDDQF